MLVVSALTSGAEGWNAVIHPLTRAETYRGGIPVLGLANALR